MLPHYNKTKQKSFFPLADIQAQLQWKLPVPDVLTEVGGAWT